jgi:hypothetical protein
MLLRKMKHIYIENWFGYTTTEDAVEVLIKTAKIFKETAK